MNGNLARLTWTTAAAILPALPSACGDGGSAAKGNGAADRPPGAALALTPEAGGAIGLVVEEIQPAPLALAVSAPSIVRADQDAIALVAPTIEGRVSGVFASWGDRVRAGQVLAHLESVEVGEAKAAYFQAKAGLGLAEANLARKRRLFEEQIIAQKDLIEAEAEYTTVMAQADAAEKALHVIGFTEEEVADLSESHDLTAVMPVVSPIDGTVVDRQAVLGALAEPSGELFTVMDLGRVWVDAEVYEKDLAKVRPGQRVEVSLTAYPGETFAGRVRYIGDALNEERRTVVVRTVVDNPDGRLKPGMFATSRIVVEERSGAIIVPEGTVLEEGGRSLVVIEDDAGFRLRDVRPGLTSDGQVEILTGLSVGERVVTRGQYQIATQILADAGAK